MAKGRINIKKSKRQIKQEKKEKQIDKKFAAAYHMVIECEDFDIIIDKTGNEVAKVNKTSVKCIKAYGKKFYSVNKTDII